MDENTTPQTTPPTGKNNTAIWVTIIVIVVLLIVGFFLMQNKNNDQEQNEDTSQDQVIPTIPDTTPTATPSAADNMPTPTTTPTSTAQETKTFTIEGGEFYYKPNKITVNKGDKVKIIFNNVGGFHDLVIDEFSGARTPRIQGNQTSTIEFTADKTGSFAYYCSVGSHRQMGMEGTLIVQ